MDELIKVENLVVRYGENTVLDGINLALHRGEILVILGGSGSGKSTLLRHIVGLRQPEEGRVMLFGRDLYGEDDDEREESLKRIGMLFQSGALFNSLTLEENIAMPLIEHRGVAPEVAAVIARMKLAMVGLENAARLLPAEISGGMKKRAGLGGARARDPEVLLFDEPSAGLDPVTARALDDLILDLRARLGVGIVVVSHELGSINVIADHAIMIDRGKIIAEGPIAQVRESTDPIVHAFFNREARREDAGTRPIAELLRMVGK